MKPLRILSLLFLCILANGKRCVSQVIASENAANPQTTTAAEKIPPSKPRAGENFNVLSIQDMNLKADPPIVGEKANLPGFTRELLRVQWRDLDPIDLYVIRPANVSHPPVVLYLYSFPSESQRFLNDAFCRMLTKDGYAAVGFVSNLTGQRYHDRPVKEWFISELQESLVSSVHDVQMIMNYLTTRNDLDLDRVGMFGQGSGGTIALLAASVDPRIKAIDVMDPWGDWPDFLAKSTIIADTERANYLTPEFLKRVTPFDPVKWLPQFQKRPLRIQQALFNPIVPEAARKKIETAAPSETEIAQYHDTKEYSEKVSANGKMLDWLHTQLQTSPKQLTASEFLQRAVASDKHGRSQ